jgi:hypothetical protein
MIGDKKVVVVTPAGRKKYMEILVKYILREKKVIDEYRIWINTKNPKDIAYFKELAFKHKGFITLDERFMDEDDCGSNQNIHRFFDKCIEEDTVYIRLDDDMVWLQPNCLENLAKYRIENPEPFLIFGTIINNGVVDSLLQNFGYYNNNEPFNYHCTDTIAFKNPSVCESKHRYMLDKYLKKLKTPESVFKGWIVRQYDRVSINCISWLGSTFKEFEGKVGGDEEQWLASDYPQEIKTPNVIFGGAYCSHFAFHPQREYMDKTIILDEYKQLSEYLDINLKDYDFDKIQWNKLSNETKLFIYQILKENNSL